MAYTGSGLQDSMTLDLHGMDSAQAKKWLQARVSAAPGGTRQILVIHGYRGGTALQNMVRRSFRHPRVERVILGLNPGETLLLLKKD